MKKHIWEGAVGISLEPKQSRTGDYFWTFELVRCFKQDGSDEMRYASHFTERNAEAMGRALSRAFQFMTETSASSFASHGHHGA